MRSPATSTGNMGEDVLIVENLRTWFPIKGGVLQRTVGYVKAVDGVSFSIKKGEVFGVVGESGCGKTTLAKTIMGLIKPTSGSIYFDGVDLLRAPRKELERVRRKMQIIFQDPYASLDPRQTVSSMLLEAMKIHKVVSSRAEGYRRAVELLERVGLSEEHMYRFPHEFSGGQRQRIAIARALVTNPEFLVLDEPTSFLDVSVQSSILNLLKDLHRTLNLTYLFITHNLAVIYHMSDRVAVMYLGKIVEIADKDTLFTSPKHPYTYYLLQAIPVPDPEARRERALIKGDVPSPVNPPPGCRFHPRCPYATDKCRREEPLLTPKDSSLVACHYEISF